MKTYLIAFSLCITSSISLAQDPPPVAATRPVPKTAPVKRHPDGRPIGVPFSATKIADGAWRAMEGGKPIVYRSTPFGFSKVSEVENGKIQRMIDGKPDQSAEIPAGMTVAEKDGKLSFKRITPFGDYLWEKDKNDLTPVEKALWLRTEAALAKGEVKK